MSKTSSMVAKMLLAERKYDQVRSTGAGYFHKRSIFPLILILVLCGFNFFPHQMAQASFPSLYLNPAKVSAKVIQAFQGQDSIPVIVSFVDPVPLTATTFLRTQRVQAVRSSIVANLSANDFHVYREYSHVPAVAGQADPQAIAALQADPRVAFIQIDERSEGHLAESVPALGADVVHNTYNITGQGVRVAVLDTGIDTDHPDLSSSIFAQHCFSQGSSHTGDCLPNRTLEGASAEDENGHGSNVSGIITSNGVVSSVGFAPNAQIVAVRVLDAHGAGWSSDWLAALNWIIANQSTLQVKIINMSLGTYTLFSGNCDAAQPSSSNALNQLHNLGVTVFASAGNQGSSTQISSPACNGNVIAVGATYDGDVGRQPYIDTYQYFFGSSWPDCADTTTSLHTITCFTNSASELDILAPGAPITSDYIGGGLSTFWGTSQASPTAAGVAALLLQADPGLTPDQIESKLKTTGTLITDSRNGLQFPLINALAAIRTIVPQTPTPITLSGAHVIESQPVFSWNAVPLATRYEMRLDQHNPPLTTVISANVTTYRPVTPLLVGTYYWQVRALSSIASSSWSTPRMLVVDSAANDAPPRNFFTVNKPTLTWNRVAGAVRYEVQVANNALFSLASTYNAGSKLSFQVVLSDGPYYWQVRACSDATAASCGAWSAAEYFIVDVP